MLNQLHEDNEMRDNWWKWEDTLNKNKNKIIEKRIAHNITINKQTDIEKGKERKRRRSEKKFKKEVCYRLLSFQKITVCIFRAFVWFDLC